MARVTRIFLRILLASACVAAVAFMAPGGAYAAENRVFIGNPDGTSVGSYGNYVMNPGSKLTITFGISGAPDPGDHVVTLDLSSFGGKVVYDSTYSGDCSASGALVTCHGPILADPHSPSGGALWPYIMVRVLEGTAPGKAGTLVARSDAASNTKSAPIWVANKGVSQNMEITLPEVWTNLGEVVEQPATIRNPGPNPIIVFGWLTYMPHGADWLGVSGCKEGVVISGTATDCAFTDPMAPGESRNVKIKVRINSLEQAPGGCYCHSIGTLHYSNGGGGTTFVSTFQPFNTHINGVYKAPSGKKPPQANGAAGAPGSAPPSAEPSLAPSEEPSLAPSSSTSPDTDDVLAIRSDVPRSPSRPWMLWTAIAVVVVLGAAAPFGWRRLRRPGEPTGRPVPPT
jgi:hypothetical protein